MPIGAEDCAGTEVVEDGEDCTAEFEEGCGVFTVCTFFGAVSAFCIELFNTEPMDTNDERIEDLVLVPEVLVVVAFETCTSEVADVVVTEDEELACGGIDIETEVWCPKNEENSSVIPAARRVK